MNMKGLAKILRAVVMTMAAGQAMAATDRVDVKVTGDIVPPACVPAVSGGAVFDYGGIKAASLAKDDYTVLDRKSLDFSVKCDSPTKIAFKATDGRPGTNVVPLNKVLLTVAATANTPLYGLGAEGGKLIGAYRLMVSSVKIDNAKNAKGLISHDNGNTWGTSLYMWLNPVANTLSSLGDASSSNPGLPAELTTITGKIEMQAAINKSSELDLTKIINLDGQTTIQVIYL